MSAISNGANIRPHTIRDTIRNHIVECYGENEADNPSYDLEELDRAIRDDLLAIIMQQNGLSDGEVLDLVAEYLTPCQE